MIIYPDRVLGPTHVLADVTVTHQSGGTTMLAGARTRVYMRGSGLQTWPTVVNVKLDQFCMKLTKIIPNNGNGRVFHRSFKTNRVCDQF